jgi:Rrf2 family iron-sulfur cluster assembly transcriptional regulator
MRLSTRGRFAVTTMIDLALRDGAHPMPLQEMAVRHGISLSYLEQVFAKLRQRGLVESTRGPGGGYTLGRSATAITVADIISAIDETEEPEVSVKHEGSDLTLDLWDDLHSTLHAYMKTITLHSLASGQRAKGYQIEERKPTKRGVFQKLRTEPVRTTAPNSVFALAQSLR